MKRRMLTLTMGLLLVALASLAWGNPIPTSSSSGSDWWFFSIMILFQHFLKIKFKECQFN